MFILDMSSKKTIAINPKLFELSGKKSKAKTLKKERKPKPNRNLIRPNTLKKNLLKRIKEHQKQEQQKKEVERKKKIDVDDIESKETEDFSNEFSSTLNYLDQLAKDKKTKKKERRKRQKKSIEQSSLEESELKINTDLPKSLQSTTAPVTFHNTTMKIPPSPPYGILKNGSKPLYRDWKKKTVKNTRFSESDSTKVSTEKFVNNDNNNNDNNNNDNNNDENYDSNHDTNNETEERILTRREKLAELQKKVREKEEIKDTNIVKCRKRTFKKKYKLGKNKQFKDKVGVLICNQDTRKKIQKDKQVLKKKSVEEIKTYLRNRGFLNVGSDAPVDVLRQMYENSILTGEIKNTGKGSLIDNYLSEVTEKLLNKDKKEDGEKEMIL